MHSEWGIKGNLSETCLVAWFAGARQVGISVSLLGFHTQQSPGFTES